MELLRKVLERAYKDSCNIYEYKKQFNEETKVTEFKNVLVQENIKCRLSFDNIPSSTDGLVSMVTQVVKLFLRPDIEVKPNSIIEVKRDGRILRYKNSGSPAIYSSHQEIVLNLFEDKA